MGEAGRRAWCQLPNLTRLRHGYPQAGQGAALGGNFLSLTDGPASESNTRFFNTFFPGLQSSRPKNLERNQHETHLSAVHRPPQAHAWFSCPDEDQGRPPGHQCASCQGSGPPGCLIERIEPAAGQVRVRDARLVKQAEFDQVFADNQRARTDSLVVMARPNQLGHARLGMVVSKRLLPRAVDRNRVKRCVREVFRLQLDELPACDFVVRLTARPKPGEEARELGRTLQRAGQRALEKWQLACAVDTAPLAPDLPK